ncbi:hypothetical protein ACJJIX_20760 [Microbulbifer sp. VAAC004]|uniref:hypothetical protein n=1 Tax=unclassified Microbulbifer TaxID=2619833 RepID=UPI0040397E2B
MDLNKFFSSLTLLLFLFVSVQVQADAESILGKANRLMSEGKFSEAVKLLESPDLIRNSEAQFSLYVAYEYGKGVDVDKSQALHRLLISAYLGYPPAIETMSLFADRGALNVQRSEAAKRFWEDEYYRLVDQ